MKHLGVVALVFWVVTVAMGYVGPGGRLAEQLEGMDPTMISLVPTAIFGLLLLVSVVITALWARQLGSSQTQAETQPPSGRRKFLLGGAAVTGGVAAAAAG